MSLTPFGRGRDADGPPPTRPTSTSSTGSAATGGLTAFIDQGSEFEGKLSFRDTVRIDGRFRGEISSENTLIVGETGEIEATIRSKTIVISGTVTGDLYAASKVVLHKTARIAGNVEAPSITIEEGAVFNGQLRMNSGDAKPAGTGPLKAIDGGGGASPSKTDKPKD